MNCNIRRSRGLHDKEAFPCRAQKAKSETYFLATVKQKVPRLEVSAQVLAGASRSRLPPNLHSLFSRQSVVLTTPPLATFYVIYANLG